MSGFNNSRKNRILDAAMGGASYSESEEQWLTLVTVAVTGSDTGATLKEATYTGFARIPMPPADWNAAEGGQKTNAVAMTFPEDEAGIDKIVGWATCTTAGVGTGEVIFDGSCTPFEVTEGRVPQFKAGALKAKLIDT